MKQGVLWEWVGIVHGIFWVSMNTANTEKNESVASMGFDWPLHTWPKVMVAGRFFHDDTGFTYQYLGPYQSLHLYGYRGRIQMGERVLSFGPGDITLTPRGVATRYDLAEAGFHYCIHFLDEGADASDDKHEKRKRNTASHAGKNGRKNGRRNAGENVGGVGGVGGGRGVRLPVLLSLGAGREAAVSRIVEVMQAHGAAGEDPLRCAAAGAAMQGLLLWLATRVSDGDVGENGEGNVSGWRAGVEHAASIIEHELHETIGVPDLAQRVGLSQNYLSRRFREQFGVSIPRYLLLRRMEQAKLLLGQTNLPIGRIAGRVGMPDPGHFNKQFRHLVGMSPTAWREQGG